MPQGLWRIDDQWHMKRVIVRCANRTVGILPSVAHAVITHDDNDRLLESVVPPQECHRFADPGVLVGEQRTRSLNWIGFWLLQVKPWRMAHLRQERDGEPAVLFEVACDTPLHEMKCGN